MLGRDGLYAHLRARGRHLRRVTVGMLLAEKWKMSTLQHWAGLSFFAAAYRVQP